MINANDGIKFNKTIDPHEEEFLDLPELNRNRIEDNKYAIMKNRIIMAGFFALVFVMIIGSHIVTRNAYELNMEEMEAKLFEKLTKQEYPFSFESKDK